MRCVALRVNFFFFGKEGREGGSGMYVLFWPFGGIFFYLSPVMNFPPFYPPTPDFIRGINGTT
jgi:hypothetical protein